MPETRLPELPYERIAMAGGEMPDGLGYSDQNLFLCLRVLYDSYKKQIVDRDAATREKTKLIREYEMSLLFDKICRDLSDQLKRSEIARANYRKNRTLENADLLVAALDGAPVKIDEEVL